MSKKISIELMKYSSKFFCKESEILWNPYYYYLKLLEIERERVFLIKKTRKGEMDSINESIM